MKTDIVISGIEEPDINPHTYGHLIFDKEARTIEKRKYLQQMVQA